MVVRGMSRMVMVGLAGFEPTTPWPPVQITVTAPLGASCSVSGPLEGFNCHLVCIVRYVLSGFVIGDRFAPLSVPQPSSSVGQLDQSEDPRAGRLSPSPAIPATTPNRFKPADQHLLAPALQASEHSEPTTYLDGEERARGDRDWTSTWSGSHSAAGCCDGVYFGIAVEQSTPCFTYDPDPAVTPHRPPPSLAPPSPTPH